MWHIIKHLEVNPRKAVAPGLNDTYFSPLWVQRVPCWALEKLVQGGLALRGAQEYPVPWHLQGLIIGG